MVNVTLHPPEEPGAPKPAAPRAETPSQSIVKAATAIRHVSDETGRSIGWRKLSALEDFDLTEIAGGENTRNADWMVMATVAFGVREIDGEAVTRPANKAQLRAMIARLDTHGMRAVLSLFQGDAEAAGQGGMDVDRAKN